MLFSTHCGYFLLVVVCLLCDNLSLIQHKRKNNHMFLLNDEKEGNYNDTVLQYFAVVKNYLAFNQRNFNVLLLWCKSPSNINAIILLLFFYVFFLILFFIYLLIFFFLLIKLFNV